MNKDSNLNNSNENDKDKSKNMKINNNVNSSDKNDFDRINNIEDKKNNNDDEVQNKNTENENFADVNRNDNENESKKEIDNFDESNDKKNNSFDSDINKDDFKKTLNKSVDELKIKNEKKIDKKNMDLENKNKTDSRSEKIFSRPNIIKKKRNTYKFIAIMFVVFVASAIFGTAIGSSYALTNKIIDNIKNKYSQEKKDIDSSQNESSESNKNNKFNYEEDNRPQEITTSVVHKVMKSVVAINTTSSQENLIWGLPVVQSGSGSGIIFNEDSENIYIVTNYHVVRNATAVGISFSGSEKITAHPVGKEILNDIAVISVNKSDLTEHNISDISIADFGNSDNITVADKIMTIGNSLGEGNAVTSGVVSVKDKNIIIDGIEFTMIQIDAPINPGNSGGALVDSSGKVIGVTTAKYSRYATENVGYCIPSNKVKESIQNILKSEESPKLGIEGIELNENLAKTYGLPNIGIFVQNVIDGSNASRAGIKRYDIITQINNMTIYNIKDITNILNNKFDFGDTIKIHVIREGSKDIDLSVKLEKFSVDKF
ncbi:MAG: trypsin-like peptidase domain-containing protein [Clostridiales bacterium]|jgi:serine protease Do|nr:trypsin-like peptidase domain-containing protein [Clostridiales bacterium]